MHNYLKNDFLLDVSFIFDPTYAMSSYYSYYIMNILIRYFLNTRHQLHTYITFLLLKEIKNCIDKDCAAKLDVSYVILKILLKNKLITSFYKIAMHF